MGRSSIIRYRFWKAVQSLRSWIALKRANEQQASQASEWEAVERLSGFQMRKRGPDGQWIYRDPTDEERDQASRDKAW
jgi:hypothetical protein